MSIKESAYYYTLTGLKSILIENIEKGDIEILPGQANHRYWIK